MRAVPRRRRSPRGRRTWIGNTRRLTQRRELAVVVGLGCFTVGCGVVVVVVVVVVGGVAESGDWTVGDAGSVGVVVVGVAVPPPPVVPPPPPGVPVSPPPGVPPPG